MNKVILMGRLTRDPEIRRGQTGVAIARYSLAVDRRFKREGEDVSADFFNLISFGRQGEFVEKYLRKGTKILIDGELRNNNYTNKDGQKVYSIEIVTNSVEFAESKPTSPRNENTPTNGDNAPYGQQFVPIYDNAQDLPF